MNTAHDAVRRSLTMLQGQRPSDCDRWVDLLCDPEPWTTVPDEPLPRFLDQWIYWDYAVPPRVVLRHVRLRKEAGYEHTNWLVRRYTQAAGHVQQFLIGANQALLLLDEAVDLVLVAGGPPEALVPLLASEAGRRRVAEVAGGLARPGGSSGVTALALLVHVDDPSLHSAVRSAALASHNELRETARALLEQQPDAVDWLLTQLGKGSAPQRGYAAELVGRLGDAAAADALRDRFAKEKTESVRVAVLVALQRLGVDVGGVLDRDDLVVSMTAEAKKKGTRPKGLQLDALPTLYWRDGSEVPLALVDAWIALCHRQKKPTPTPMLSVLARGLEPASAAAFAIALFRFWVALDNTDTDPYWGHQKGTATADKGLFALVGALADASIVAEVRTYVTTHYGWRSAQCKAMLAMLAYVESPSGIQYLLEVASRFRTRGIKLAAQAEVEDLALRHGWTQDELADRTLGTAGLEEEPLTYRDEGGEPTRRFWLRLRTDLTLSIVDEEAAQIKALPKARTGEDTASERSAKGQLSAARKELKGFVSVQTARLHDAMLTQRAWPVELWRMYTGHPVAGELCRRLLWQAGEVRFRLEDDGGLVGVDQEAVSLPPNAQVRLTHALFLTQEEAARWGEHLADYEIVPLFPQIGRPTWTPDDPAAEWILADVTGSAMRLRGLARRLGYDVASAGDGGYIHAFERDHPRLGLSVELRIDELRHPIEDVPVTLQYAQFVADGHVVQLGRVPGVLLSEVRADLDEIVAALTGV